MKRNENCSTTVSKKGQAHLSELRLQKEKILKDMKIHEERKKMRMRNSVQHKKPIITTNTITENLNEEKSKKFPKFQNKSFSEIMQEANEKEMLKKRNASMISEIPAKKQKLSMDNRLRNNYDTSLRPINSAQKTISTSLKSSNKSIGRGIIAQSASNTIDNNVSKSKSSNNQFSSRSSKCDNKTSNQPPCIKKDIPRGIMAQNSTKVIPKSVSQFPNKGIISQGGFSETKKRDNVSNRPSTSTVNRGILAQNKAITTQYSSGSEEERDSDLDSFIDDTERCLDDNVRKEIYQSLRFDPSKYERVSYYDDCKNMESSAKEIQNEETKSMKIAKVEDLKEAKLEMQRLKKKGKL